MSHHASSCLATSWPTGCLRSSCSDSFDVLNEPKNWQRLMPGDVVLERADEAQPVGRAVALDVHDGGAVVGERLGGDRPDADPREVGDLDALERQAARRAARTAVAARRGRRAARAERVEHLAGVLADVGRRAAPRDRRARRLDERARRRAACGRSAACTLVPVLAHREVLERQHVGRPCSPGASVTPRAMPPSNSSIFACCSVNAVIASRTSVERVHERVGRQHPRLVGRPVLGGGPLGGDGAGLDHPRHQADERAPTWRSGTTSPSAHG